MQTIEGRVGPGWDVYGSDRQKVGGVRDVGPNYILVEKGFLFPSDLYIPSDVVESIDDGQQVVTLSVPKDGIDDRGWTEPPEEGEWEGWAARRGTTSTGSETARVPVHEEQLRATKTSEEVGQVEVRKDVRSEEQTLDVPIRREQVEITRRPVDRAVEGDAAFGEDGVTIPVTAERVEVTKEPRVVEEVEVSKRTVEDRQRVGDTVRREEVHVEGAGDSNVAESRASDAGVVDRGAAGSPAGDKTEGHEEEDASS